MRTQHTPTTAPVRRWLPAPLLAVVVGLFIALGGTPSPTARAEPPLKVSPEGDEAEALKKIAVVRSMKLAEVLELGEDDETRRKLDTLLSSYDVKLLNAENALQASVRRLRKGVRDGLGDKELNRLSDDVITNRARIDALRLERMKKLGTVLDGSQRARAMLFLPRFERKVRRAIGKARRDKRGKPNRKGRKGRNRRGAP